MFILRIWFAVLVFVGEIQGGPQVGGPLPGHAEWGVEVRQLCGLHDDSPGANTGPFQMR